MTPASALRPAVADLGALGEARGRRRGSDRLEEIATALGQSRMAMLLVETGRRVPGSIGAAMGAIANASDTPGDAAAGGILPRDWPPGPPGLPPAVLAEVK